MEMNRFMIRPNQENTNITGQGTIQVIWQFYCVNDFRIK
jgi:hypothetical protein